MRKQWVAHTQIKRIAKNAFLEEEEFNSFSPPNRKGKNKMTTTTDKRQISIFTNKILAKYDIDNLQLEIDLISAFHAYLTERLKSGDKVGARERIEKALQLHEKRATKNEQMESRIFKATGLYVNERWYMDGIIDFLTKKDEQGETIEVFAERCKADPFNMPKFFKIAEKPAYLKDVWGLAFTDTQSDPAAEEYPTL